MDLPDCPPGAEGYEDSVVEVAMKKPYDSNCTKAEQEFQEHLNSLKIRVEDGTTRPMAERRSRDVTGRWIYLCYPCAAICNGESVLQNHLTGKKHKAKLALRNVWPKTVFEEHPCVLVEKGIKTNSDATEKTLQKMAEEVELHNETVDSLDPQLKHYKSVKCHIQKTLDETKTPLIGLEYLIEHPPEESHHEPTYICTLCIKHGHPRTIVNHLTCYWHRFNYLNHHYPKAMSLAGPYRLQAQYREGMLMILSRLSQRIEEKFGRRKPLHIDKDEYNKNKEAIHKWICQGYHFSELNGPTFEEVVDANLIESLCRNNDGGDLRKKEPSPPVVAAPSVKFNNYSKPSSRNVRRATSAGSLSDVSGDERPHRLSPKRSRPATRYPYHRGPTESDVRFNRDQESSYRSRYAVKNEKVEEKQKAPNHDYKVKLAESQRQQIKAATQKTLAYHEKNPEKHPLYPEEWKKFWNRRYKEIQAEGGDPSKHDFKPEWIVFWTARMKELHEEEMRLHINELYRKLCLTPPSVHPPPRAASPNEQRRSERRRTPDRRGVDLGRDVRPTPTASASASGSAYSRGSPPRRHRRTRSRSRSRSPQRPRYQPRARSPLRNRSPVKRQRSPLPRRLRTRSRSPSKKSRSPVRTNFQLESLHQRSQSPLSRREALMRNKSPERQNKQIVQTVLISDDEGKPGGGGLSPWNSDDDIESVSTAAEGRLRARPRSRPRSRTKSRARSRPPSTATASQDLAPNDDVVSTLRLLVALEDYLGSLGPKIVDLLTEALKMEKEKANSSEDLLEREESVALMETAKEKLKGAVQAGLVPTAAAAAARSAIVRVASLLHEADRRIKLKHQKQQSNLTKASSMPVAGVGDVNRAQIAKQMAAALIAQGKTDVSSEELAQLVDAVVGMAEAKKREAEVAKLPAAPRAASIAAAAGPSATALQMLQSAYDEYDKKDTKDDAPDAMDGLSDSDLETLLKNFNELSAEEQHSLIAYLKKLEAREPKRVERLREYVTSAAPTPQASQPPADKEPPVKALVTVESDDDDYTVEEVFNLAKEKVKEDQMRQEMEIVTKSLLETKAPPVETPVSASLPGLDIINATSNENLLAIVQASIASNTAATKQNSEVPNITTPLRVFGDQPNTPINPSPGILPVPMNRNSGLMPNPSPMQGGMGNQNQNFNHPGNMGNTPMNSNMGNMPPNNDRNMGNMPPNNDRNMGNMPPNNDRNMGNMPPNNDRNMGNMPPNNDRNMGNMPPNIDRNMGNMPMNNRNMENTQMEDMNFGMNNSEYDRNMGMMNNRNAPMSNSGNMRNMYDNNQMNTWDNRPPVQQNMQDSNQAPINVWESRPPMQQNNMHDNNQGFRNPNPNFNHQKPQFNQGPRHNFNNMQQDRFNQPQQFGNNNFGGGGRGRGRGYRGGRGRW